MPASTKRARTALSDRLRDLRRAADLTGVALAERLGDNWAQPKVSKIESGRQLPSERDLREWAEATSGDEVELLALLARANHEYSAFKDAFEASGGADAAQNAIASEEWAAKTIGTYQPAAIPGLLQTPAYAREMLRLPGGPADHGAVDDEIGRLIAARMRRKAVLYEPGRSILILVGEGALRNRVASNATMFDQMHHIAQLAIETEATIGIVPFDSPAPVMCFHGWKQVDDIVTIETTAGDLEIADPDAVGRYTRYLDLLAGAARCGKAAAKLCRAIASEAYAVDADRSGDEL